MLFFFFNDPAPTEIYTLSLHDALPISQTNLRPTRGTLMLWLRTFGGVYVAGEDGTPLGGAAGQDRKSTRLNSSHPSISYAVFCLKKKKKEQKNKYAREEDSATSVPPQL